MVRRLPVLMALAMLFCSLNIFAAVNDEDMFIRCVAGDNEVYEREPLLLTVTLFTQNPDIAYANVVEPVVLSKGEFASSRKVEPAGDPYVCEEKGKKYYCFPLEASLVTFAEKGKYELCGGEFEIGVSYPVIINDPFWGKVRSSEVKKKILQMEKSQIKVKSLPSPPENGHFSGSVGEFTIETIIPRGDIVVNEEATAYIVLRGEGMIAESILPEYHNAFKKGIKLKSVTESRSEVIDNGRMISELQLECTFIPTSREDAEIGEVRFEYFNPSTGKYSTVVSSPVKVAVKSSTVRHKSMEI